MTSPTQKSVLGLTVLMVIGLTIFFVSRHLTLETRKRDGLLFDMIANISGNLERLDSGFDGIITRIRVTRNRLQQLIAYHRENLLACAVLREKLQRRTSGKKWTRRRRRSAVT